MASPHGSIRLPQILVLALALVCGSLLAHGIADSKEDGAQGPKPKMAPVSGKLTYDDETPIPGARIQIVFIPLEPEGKAGNRDKPSLTDVDPDKGTFEFTSTYEEGDGATVGMHRVMITVLDADGNLNGAIPEVFANPQLTPLKIRIEPRKNWIHFQVPKP